MNKLRFLSVFEEKAGMRGHEPLEISFSRCLVSECADGLLCTTVPALKNSRIKTEFSIRLAQTMLISNRSTSKYQPFTPFPWQSIFTSPVESVTDLLFLPDRIVHSILAPVASQLLYLFVRLDSLGDNFNAVLRLLPQDLFLEQEAYLVQIPCPSDIEVD